MAIQFECPGCSALVRVPDNAAGKIGRCPKCHQRVQIPKLAPPAAASAPAAPPSPAPPAPAPSPPTPDFQPFSPRGPLLGDTSTVFVLPPETAPPADGPVIGPPPEMAIGPPPEFAIGPPAEPVAPPPPAAPAANPEQAREEYEQGQAWLTKPHVPGAGWPAADRAVQHFTRAAQLDPTNADYATRAGVACQASIERFLESWGQGPLTSIAAFHAEGALGRQIDKQEQTFRPSGLSADNIELLRTQANDALRWFERALAIDPEDAVTRCRRAELLRNVGAFAASLADVKAVLSSPLVPTKARDAAQAVADFILEEDSPLRRYLTRTQAQQLAAPTGITLPTSAARRPPAAPPPTDAELPFLFDRGAGEAASDSPFPSPDTVGGLPLVTAPTSKYSSQKHASNSVASRLKQKRSGNWVRVVVPVLLGLCLLGAGMGYMYANRVKFVADLPGEDLAHTALRKTFFVSEFGVPEDQMTRLVNAFREEPETLRTQLRLMILRGSAQGLDVSIRAGDQARLVKVDLRSHPPLKTFCQEHAAKLEAPLATLRTGTLRQFASDFTQANSAGMSMGNLGTYLETLGGDLLVHGLGYHVEAQTPGGDYRCIFEDDDGAVYFLLPPDVVQFDVIPRAFESPNDVFGTDFRYHVTVQPATAPAPLKEPAAADTEPAAPANDAAMEPQPETPQTDASLPANFFGENN